MITCPLPEPCAPETQAFKNGHQTIAEIGKARMRRAGKQIADANATLFPGQSVWLPLLRVKVAKERPPFDRACGFPRKSILLRRSRRSIASGNQTRFAQTVWLLNPQQDALARRGQNGIEKPVVEFLLFRNEVFFAPFEGLPKASRSAGG